MLKGLFKTNKPELEDLPDSQWSNDKFLPAHCWHQIAGDQIKIPADPFSKVKGGTITDVAGRETVCRFKATVDNKTIHFIDIKSHEGFLAVTSVADGTHKIFTYKPNIPGQAASSEATGLHRSPLYQCGSVEKDNSCCVYSKCVDDKLKTIICKGTFANGGVVFTEDGRKEPIAKAIQKKSNGIQVVFLQVSKGIDTLAMCVFAMICVAESARLG